MKISAVRAGTLGLAAVTVTAGLLAIAPAASAAGCTYSVTNGGHTANATCPYNGTSGTFRVVAYSCSGSACNPNPIYGNWVFYGSTSHVTTAAYIDPTRISVQGGGPGG